MVITTAAPLFFSIHNRSFDPGAPTHSVYYVNILYLYCRYCRCHSLFLILRSDPGWLVHWKSIHVTTTTPKGGVCGQFRKLKTIHHCSISAHSSQPPPSLMWLLCPFMFRFATFKVKPISSRSSRGDCDPRPRRLRRHNAVWDKGWTQTPCLGGDRKCR